MIKVDEIEKINELPDSLEWGTASKGTKRKVYGDILKGAEDMVIKVERMNNLEKVALGETSKKQFITAVKENVI